jgi:pimeloyl-ACP methyl ester carboxylesterase
MASDAAVQLSDWKSTNVRILAVVVALRAAARVSPELAAAGLLRLFLTPRRHRVPERERAWVAGAAEHRVRTAGRELRLWSWGDGPPVLLVHGWEGRGSQMGAFAAPLAAAGFRAVAYDAPGHGASDGERSSIPEMADAVAGVAALLGGVHAVVAHSAGAAAASVALAAGTGAERLVYLAPPDDPVRFLRLAGAMVGLPPVVARHAQRRIERRFDVSFDAFRGARLAPRIGLPLLAFHDPADQEVPFDEARALVSHWPAARLVPTPGLGHRRLLRDPEVVRQAVEFVAGG